MACPGELELVDFAQGNLAVARRTDLDAHVDGCPDCRAALVSLLASDASSETKPGARIGRFEVTESIGRGGAGEVFAARDPDLDRVVALKLLLAGSDSAKAGDRLLREAQAAARLAHPNVVAVHEVGVVPQGIFIAMERVVGATLAGWLERTRTRAEILDAIIQAGRGIEAAHRAGLVHRDIKPSNILVGEDGRVRVGDFGLAAAWDAPVGEPGSAPPASLLDERLTQTGSLLGTPAYMAPEQFLGAAVGPAADQFALAVVTYEALCSERPFAGATVPELADAVVHGRRRPWPTGKSVPSRIRAAIDRALATEPDARWPDVTAFLAELEHTIRPRRRSWIVAALVLGAAGGGVAAMTARSSDAPTQKCANAGAGLEQVLPPDLDARIRRALSDDPTGTATTQVAAELERRGTAWRTMRIDACRAHAAGTESAELLDLRTMCLDERRAELATLVERLTTGKITAERAVVAAFKSPDLAACADVRGLRARTALPADPKLREQITTLEADLAALRLSADLGGSEARTKATAAVTRAKQIGYSPLLAEAELINARYARSADDAPAAEKSLYEAIYAAEAGHDDRRATRAWIDLTALTGVIQHKSDEGRKALGMANAALTRLGEDHRLEAELVGTAGKFHLIAGELDEAEKQLRRSLSLRETNLPDDLHARSVALNDLSVLLKERAQFKQARELQVASLEIDRKLYGDHPKVATSLNNIAELDRTTGKYAEAEAGYKAALAIQEKMLAPDHRDTARTVGNLGLLARDRSDCPGAEPWNKRALEMYRKANSPTDVGRILHNIGLCYAENPTTYNKALAAYDEAIVEKLKILPADHPSMAITLDAKGYVLGQLKRYDEALDFYRRAMAIDIKTLGPDHPDIAFGYLHIAELEGARGKPAASLDPLLKVTKILDAFPDADPFDRAAAHYSYAQALWEVNKRADAVAQAKLARAGFVAAPEDPLKTAGLKEIDGWLAKHRP